MTVPSLDADIAIRSLETQDEYEACVELQRATWGDDFRELVTPAMLQIAQKVGGIGTGAFLGARLVGFVFGLTGVRAGSLVHWSHMLAVAEPYRDQGIGRRLKDHQRAQLRALGVGRMLWTFDPLVARNAHLNLQRLGARVVAYVRDMYGETPMSKTASVIGTDRFVIEWELTGERGTRCPPPPEAALTDAPLIATVDDPLPSVGTVRVAVPNDIQDLKARDPDAAQAWRAQTRRAFEHYLGQRYVITAFHRQSGALPWYRLDRPT
jgi:chorismate synthase